MCCATRLLPVVTIMGLKFAELLGGAILTETVFAWPGMGRYMFEAIKSRDYPVIQGGTLLFALIFIAEFSDRRSPLRIAGPAHSRERVNRLP